MGCLAGLTAEVLLAGRAGSQLTGLRGCTWHSGSGPPGGQGGLPTGLPAHPGCGWVVAGLLPAAGGQGCISGVGRLEGRFQKGTHPPWCYHGSLGPRQWLLPASPRQGRPAASRLREAVHGQLHVCPRHLPDRRLRSHVRLCAEWSLCLPQPSAPASARPAGLLCAAVTVERQRAEVSSRSCHSGLLAPLVSSGQRAVRVSRGPEVLACSWRLWFALLPGCLPGHGPFCSCLSVSVLALPRGLWNLYSPTRN